MEYADMILLNGDIYLSDPFDGRAQAVAIKGKKILFLGTDEQCLHYRNSGTKVINLCGRLVIPGIIDGHTHPETIAKSRWKIQMPEFDDMDSLLAWVRDYCREHDREEVPYFFGECYPSEMFDEKGPRKEWIDEYVFDRPVRLQDFTDHACWFNSKAMEMMEVTPENTEEKFFARDEKGELTGWMFEPLLKQEYEDKIFEKLNYHPMAHVNKENMMPFLNKLTSWGVTAIYDGFTEGEEAMKFFYDLDKEGELNFYYQGMCLLDDFEKLEETIERTHQWQEKYTSEHVGIHTVKFFLDQTNEMGNSASLEPHYNDPDRKNCGVINMEKDELKATLLRLNEECLDLHIHVVGDRGFRVACDAYEEALEEAKVRGTEWVITMELAHCELVHPDDMIRPAKLGIIINWSCHWAGGYFGDAAKEYLGEERFNSMYDFTKMIETGAIVTYSSDTIGMCEEDRANPWFGMQISATRIDIENPEGGIREPASARLSVPEMIKGYTRFGAIPLRLEDQMGIIEPGKIANLVVLNKDVFTIPLDEINTVKPEMVLFDGKIVCNKRGR